MLPTDQKAAFRSRQHVKGILPLGQWLCWKSITWYSASTGMRFKEQRAIRRRRKNPGHFITLLFLKGRPGNKTLWERIFGRGCTTRIILLTCLISAKQLSWYPTRENKSFTLLLCWTTQLIQDVPNHNKNLVTSWQCFETHIFNTDLLSAKLQHRTPVLTARTVRFISAPLILTLWGRSTGIICLFTPITLYSVFRLLTRADKVPEVQ